MGEADNIPFATTLPTPTRTHAANAYMQIHSNRCYYMQITRNGALASKINCARPYTCENILFAATFTTQIRTPSREAPLQAHANTC